MFCRSVAGHTLSRQTSLTLSAFAMSGAPFDSIGAMGECLGGRYNEAKRRPLSIARGAVVSLELTTTLDPDQAASAK